MKEKKERYFFQALGFWEQFLVKQEKHQKSIVIELFGDNKKFWNMPEALKKDDVNSSRNV